MNNESAIKHLISAIKQIKSGPRSTVYLMLILIAVLFVAEMVEVFFFAFIQPFPKWAIVVSHVFLLAVFIHYLNVYHKYQSQIDKLSELNEQLRSEIEERKHTEDSLRRYEYIISTTSDLMSMVDGNYIYQAVNDAYLRAHNKKRDEIVGRSVAELLSEKVFQELAKKYLDRCFNGEMVRYQAWFEYDGIGRRYMDVSYYPYVAEGHTADVIVVARDITEHKRMDDARRESEEKFKAIFNNSHDGILVADPGTRRFHLGNDRICRMLGYSLEELKELGVEDIHPEEDIPTIVEQFRKLVNGEIALVKDVRVKRKDTSIFFADIGASNVHMQGRRYSMGMFRDVTERKQAEEALRDSAERLRAFGNALPDIAFILDEHGRYVEILAQPQKEKLLYADMNALKGRLLHDVLPRKDADLFLSVVRRTIETQENQTIEYVLAVPAGERWFEGRTAPLQTSGKDKMVVWVSRDITERKAAEVELHEKEHLLSESQRLGHIGSFLYDMTGRISWSEELYRLYGVSPDTFTPTVESFLSLIHPDDRQAMQAWIAACAAGDKPDALDFRINLPDGTIRFVRGWGDAVLDAEKRLTYIAGLVQDITERKRMEEDLRKYSKDLEKMVRERTADLEEKTIQAEAANRAKSEFLANMSHELRTPLNAVIGFSDLLLSGVTTGDLADDQKDYLKNIWESGKHLNRIVDDILAMTEIESNMVELELSEFSLKETIEAALGRFSRKGERQWARISADIPDDIGLIIADEQKVRQTIQNLLGNAFKFTPGGGSVRVSAQKVRSAEFGVGSWEQQQDRFNSELRTQYTELPEGARSELRTQHSELDADFIEISVADTGIGIAKEDLGRLFHPFQQLAPSLTKKYEGVGLGLSICKKYVELHGGKIWVESEVGKGSTFVFVIPVRQGARI